MKVVKYIKDSFAELKNSVSWPTWIDGQKLTVLVAVFSIVFSLAIFGIDQGFTWLIKNSLGFFKG
jgi:preprotein translocase subunit SecE